jgi:hypothetical protein
MADVTITKLNESHLLACSDDEGTTETLYQMFSFLVPNSWYHPKVRKGLWDGKIKLYNKRTNTLYIGLKKKLIDKLEELDISYSIDSSFDNLNKGESLQDIENYLKSLKIDLTPYQHQIDMVKAALHLKRLVAISPTGSGKSFAYYLYIKYLLEKILAKDEQILLVVPTTSLVLQMQSDMIEYDKQYNTIKDKIHIIMGGHEKDSVKPITISTWQSIQKQYIEKAYGSMQNYFKRFKVLIMDECLHGDSRIKTIYGYKKISDIKIGDKVFSYNIEKNIFEEDEVLSIFENLDISSKEKMYRLKFYDPKRNVKSYIKVTGNHKFLTKNRGYVRADSLTQEDDVVDSIDYFWNGQNNKFSKKRKESISKSSIGKKYSKQRNANVRESLLKYYRTHSAWNKNLKMSEKYCEKCRNRVKTKKTEEQRLAQSIREKEYFKTHFSGRKGKHQTKEWRENQSKRLKGKIPIVNTRPRKKEWYIKQSNTMKLKIKRGEFTPCITNSFSGSKTYIIKNNQNICMRSSWDAMFQLLNPDFLYEKIRVPYLSSIDNKIHIYIIDFVDEKNKILYEVKPQSWMEDLTIKDKEKGAIIWALENGYSYKFINDDYFKKNIKNIDLNNQPQKTINSILWYKEKFKKQQEKENEIS